MIQFLRHIGIFEAKSRFPELCSEVAASGQTVIISRRGEPMVEVRPLTPPDPVHAVVESGEGVVSSRAACEARFGQLQQDFAIPEWGNEFRITSRNPLEDYWNQL